MSHSNKCSAKKCVHTNIIKLNSGYYSALCWKLYIVSLFNTKHPFVKVGKFLMGGLGPPSPSVNENINPIIRPVKEP